MVEHDTGKRLLCSVCNKLMKISHDKKTWSCGCGEITITSLEKERPLVPVEGEYFKKDDVLTLRVQVCDESKTYPILESQHGVGLIAGCRVNSIHRRDLPVILCELEKDLESCLSLIRGERKDMTWKILERNRRPPQPAPGEKIHYCLACGCGEFEVIERDDVWSVRCLNEECGHVHTPYRDRDKE